MAELLGPILARLDLDFTSLGLIGGVLSVLQAVLRATPAPAVSRGEELEELPDSAIEELPPEEELISFLPTEYDDLYDPPSVSLDDDDPTPPGADAGPFAGERAYEEPSTDDVVTEHDVPESREAHGEYAGLYTPPAPVDEDDGR